MYLQPFPISEEFCNAPVMRASRHSHLNTRRSPSERFLFFPFLLFLLLFSFFLFFLARLTRKCIIFEADENTILIFNGPIWQTQFVSVCLQCRDHRRLITICGCILCTKLYRPPIAVKSHKYKKIVVSLSSDYPCTIVNYITRRK